MLVTYDTPVIMKKVFLIVTAMSTLFSCAACAQSRSVNDTPVKSLDLNNYLGTWYEIARIDHVFEKGMDFTQAVYTLEDDGSIMVENSGIKDGKFKKSVGKAKCPDAVNEPGRLKVSFFGPFYSDYRVLMVDSDYRYALVSSKGPNYLWILSRDVIAPDDVLEEMLEEAQKRGFNIARLTWVAQTKDTAFSYEMD